MIFLLHLIWLEFCVKSFKLRSTCQINVIIVLMFILSWIFLIVRPNLIRISCQEFQVM
jgi:hypothetical protein